MTNLWYEFTGLGAKALAEAQAQRWKDEGRDARLIPIEGGFRVEASTAHREPVSHE